MIYESAKGLLSRALSARRDPWNGVSQAEPQRHRSVLTGRAGATMDKGMIGFVSRFVGIWFIAGALVALVIDAAKTIAASALTITPLGEAWSTLSLSSIMSVQTFVQQQIEPTVGGWLWDPVIQWLLLSPTWAVFGIIGFVLTYLGRRRTSVAYA
jgi:hypothetical protein